MATIGLNISGGEFGGSGGIHDQNYHYPTHSELQFYKDKGVDLIRLPIGWERVQDALGGPLDLSGDIALIKQVLVNAAALGMDVIIDVHNYGRYKGVPIGAVGGPTSAEFADFWKKMAIEFKDYPALVGYDLMNEPHDMPVAGAWKAAAQAATDAIRSVDMHNIIYIEGEGWSGAHSWLEANSNLIINDPANRIVYQAHQYFDDNNSGTYDESYEGESAYAMVGVDRLKPFVEWLKANNLKGMIGEFGVPSNDPRWLDVMKNVLDYMKANNLEGTAWAGGAWWPTTYSMYTAKPGQPDSAFMDLLQQYFSEYKDVFAVAAPVPVAPSVAVNDVIGHEVSGELVFTIVRSGDLSKASSVNYSTANGTALAGLDYTATSGTVTFAIGQATATVRVTLINDTLVETPEALTLNLSGGSNVNIVDGVGVGTINSEDVAPPPSPPSGGTGTITGTVGDDSVNGTNNDDILDGLAGNDTLNGGGGADRLTGGAGNDRFAFSSAVEANGDMVLDFASGSDKLDLSAIDANVFRKGNQAFTWVDTANFTGLTGQLREFEKDGKHYIAGDTNGDRVADFTIEIVGTKDLTPADFLGLVNKTTTGTSKSWGSMVGFVEDSLTVSAKGSVYRVVSVSDVPTQPTPLTKAPATPPATGGSVIGLPEQYFGAIDAPHLFNSSSYFL